MHLHVSWSALFCGVFAVFGVVSTLLFLENALGISPMRLVDFDVSDGVKRVSGLATLASWGIAFFLGGNFSARISEGPAGRNRWRGVLQGFLTWAVAGVLFLILASEESLLFRVILTGEGPALIHWLMFFCGLLGALAACWGGGLGSALGGRAFFQGVRRRPSADASQSKFDQAARMA
jgi:hypothetical protein